MINQNNTPAIYFKSLSIENVRCFKEEQIIDFTDKNGEPTQWTVILGNNNTGKTTLLRVLADLELEEEEHDSNNFHIPKGKWLSSIYKYNRRFNVKLSFFPNPNQLYSSIYSEKNEKSGWLFHKAIEFSSHKLIYENTHIIKYGVLKITNENSSFINNSGFIENEFLINSEEWLIQTDYAVKNGIKKAEKRLKKIKEVLKNILPDVQAFRFQTNEKTFQSYVEVQTDYGWVRINELGYGYQTLMAWVVDLAKKMFDRYPNSDEPLKEPAIVLVDELDLHLHPEWQRKIISWLSHHFPSVQFIVTAHSPLLVQSADSVNVVLLRKEGDKVKIEQPKISTFKGWTVEEILSDLMGLDNRTHSEAYLELIKDFDEALDVDNYVKAKVAFDELDKILHPTSPQRKLLKLQMTSIIPEEPVEI